MEMQQYRCQLTLENPMPPPDDLLMKSRGAGAAEAGGAAGAGVAGGA